MGFGGEKRPTEKEKLLTSGTTVTVTVGVRVTVGVTVTVTGAGHVWLLAGVSIVS